MKSLYRYRTLIFILSFLDDLENFVILLKITGQDARILSTPKKPGHPLKKTSMGPGGPRSIFTFLLFRIAGEWQLSGTFFRMKKYFS